MLSSTKPFITSRRPFTPAGGRLHTTPTLGATAALPSSRRILPPPLTWQRHTLPARCQNISSFSPAFRSSTWRLQCHQERITPPQEQEEEEEDKEDRGKEEEAVDSEKEEHKEKEEEGIAESSEPQLGFIKKVYLILATQLLATAAVSAFLILKPSLVQFIVSFPYWFLPPFLVVFLGSFELLKPLKHKHPHSVIALGAVTLIQSIFFPSFCDPSILSALLFSSSIVDHTDRCIIRPSDQDPMLASHRLYMDILILFLNIIKILQKLR
ncbi:hypothetical protein Tsubulata_014597 [Turnera subulata]|uniref:Uncharacterized protein n=1 Tax=Turnera subulata TaxID=218843 RepID=A0A9Q0GC45_9ROSI|nr:hypothetical protein Tsubulata_014597 [Turnera subulata]